jgi:hypothetical protein
MTWFDRRLDAAADAAPVRASGPSQHATPPTH